MSQTALTGLEARVQKRSPIRALGVGRFTLLLVLLAIIVVTAIGNPRFLSAANLFNALNLGIGSTIAILIFICVVIIAAVFIKGFGTAAPGTDIAKR